MNTINAIADFVAMPASSAWHKIALLIIVFLMLTVLSLALGYWINFPLSVGWIFGYAWGSLTVYGSMRPYLRS